MPRTAPSAPALSPTCPQTRTRAALLGLPARRPPRAQRSHPRSRTTQSPQNDRDTTAAAPDRTGAVPEPTFRFPPKFLGGAERRRAVRGAAGPPPRPPKRRGKFPRRAVSEGSAGGPRGRGQGRLVPPREAPSGTGASSRPPHRGLRRRDALRRATSGRRGGRAGPARPRRGPCLPARRPGPGDGRHRGGPPPFPPLFPRTYPRHPPAGRRRRRAARPGVTDGKNGGKVAVTSPAAEGRDRRPLHARCAAALGSARLDPPRPLLLR